MSLVREPLPFTRDAKTQKVRLYDEQGQVYNLYCTVGFYEDGRPGELFVRLGKHGDTTGGLLSALAIVISIALQYGIPADVLCRKLIGMRFAPSGRTKPAMGDVKSLVDIIARVLLQYAPPQADEVPPEHGPG